MTNNERLKNKIRNDIVTENQLKNKDKLKTEVKCLTGKLLLGLIFIGVSCIAIFSTVKLHMSSDKNNEMDLKRDVQKTENSNFDKVLLKLLLGQKKRNVQTETTEKPTIVSVIKKLLSGKDTSSFNVNVGMRQDQQMQQCEGSHFKRTFPDIDYAFFGYDVFFGYPLASGHDPGFTYPIFEAEYSEGRQTSDCRYKVPNGLVVVPDVSCVTSFSSTTIQNKYELSKALSASVNANGGGYGISFSASAGYKKSSSEITTGESVKIISTAKCIYYFTKISEEYMPRFTKEFVSWVTKLDKSNDSQIYIDFLRKYGTHFLTDTSFGAKFTYENTMNSKTFFTKQEAGVNVGVQASYSGMVSAGAGFNMDSSQKDEASDFQKSVTTKTITVGASPPANGDAMEWASGVKDSPVPVKYSLKPIRNLFRDKYMANLNVDTNNIFKKLEDARNTYCRYLRRRGELDSCDPIKPALILRETQLNYCYKTIPAASFRECIDICENEKDCLASSFCIGCNRNTYRYNTCAMYNRAKTHKGFFAVDTTDKSIRWDAAVFNFKIPYTTLLQFDRTAVTGKSRLPTNTDISTDVMCFRYCLQDAHCVAFSFCHSPLRIRKCETYAEYRINGLKTDRETTTYFMPTFKRDKVIFTGRKG
ncbi:uncharacterized protein [Mytilus edulis]|uniref:uncharacterized protein n=1 Tax=Mytilus edulis TaxID=6550 RepID=UPI0039F0B988